MGKEKLLTFRGVWGQADSSFEPRHFVSEPGPSGNPRLHVPGITIPRDSMSEEDADAAEAALEKCSKIVGSFGQRMSEADTPEFQEAAERFKDVTGVNALEVFELIFFRFTDY